VNILTRYDFPLFPQHFDASVDGWTVVENGPQDREWDLLIVFEAMRDAGTYKIRGGRTVFVGGEPPEISNHARGFLAQFDAVFCASARPDTAPRVSGEQHFNNWHFGFSPETHQFRYDRTTVRNLPAPVKTGDISVVTSNLNYLPMHIKRRALIASLQARLGERIDFFGRPHRPVEYKEDAILPFRFHLCMENCAVPGVWTEKIADALLSYAVPIYAGCPDIERYFPGATIPVDLNDRSAAIRVIEDVLDNSEALYWERLPAVKAARQRLIVQFDISKLVAGELAVGAPAATLRTVALRPDETFPFHRARDVLARGRRKVISHLWRRKVRLHG
jgi:hypothetical protein